MATATSKTGVSQASQLKNTTHPATPTEQKNMASPRPTRKQVLDSKDISDIRADLDDLISRIPTLSGLDLEQAKAKLIQKVSVSKKRPAKTFDRRGRFGHGIMGSLDFVRENPLVAGAISAAVLIVAQIRAGTKCSDYEDQDSCKDNKRCKWCPGTDIPYPTEAQCIRKHEPCTT